jgi:AcrR family transcriptional regulator
MPRRYELRERAIQMRATRERIVDAAIELYEEVGISRTTMRQVGLRADVAPGTLRNHFPTRLALEEAMIERLTADGPLPEPSIFEGVDALERRVELLLRAAGAFFEGAGRLYRMWQREPMLRSPWTEAGAAYGARWEELQRLALGPLSEDRDVRTLFRAVLDPPFFTAIARDGRTSEEAGAFVATVITPWLRERHGVARSPTGTTRPR